MNKQLAVIAALGFCVASSVHLLTYASVDVFDLYPSAWLLHIVCFVVFLLMLGSIPTSKENFGEMPAWSRWLIFAAMIYAGVNFGLFFHNSKQGQPDIRNGHFVLHDHGTIIRELSAEEYHVQMAYVARGFSGHWMLFFLVPALYFGFRSARS